MPLLARAGFDRIIDGAGLPGSRMVPAGAAMRSLLALKLTGAARASHAENDDFAWPHRDGLIWPHFSSVVVGLDVA